MPLHLLPIPLLVITVSLLVRSKAQSNLRQEYVFKPLSTVLVILVALLSLSAPGVVPWFTLWITVGLAFSLGGDVALMLRSNRMFLIGLVLFLVTLIIYLLAFTIPNGFHSADLITGAVLLAFAAAVYLYLQPGLGKMKGPVILYILVICFLVNRALSTFFGSAFTPTQAWLLSAGACLFLLSDLVLAINRFRHPLKAEYLSLFAYYGGQLLIALSPSYFA
jgi:uncharacterized membrane protein YhhN